MGERIDLYRDTKDRARSESAAQNVRQDNITRRGNQVLSPQNAFNNAKRDNYQTYPYNYFSGTDAKIFFGDIWVDDIITIQYNVNQSKTPIYGYASQLFDTVARGQVLVQGSLVVAFHETGYLNIIQAMLEKQRNNAKRQTGGGPTRGERALQKYQLEAKHRVAEFIPGITDGGENGVVYSENGTPQFVRQSQTIQEILQSKIISKGVGAEFFGGTAADQKARDFEDMAEMLEDTIWGDANGKPYEARFQKGLRRPDEFDYNTNGGITTGREPYSDVLNILMTFGDINDFRAEHTIISINDIHFQSQGMVVSPDGNPIAETYSFFARDINNEIGKSKVYSVNPIKLDVGVDGVEISKLETIKALEDQLVKERIPQTMILTSVAALPRGGAWKNIEGKFQLIFDQKELGAKFFEANHDIAEQQQKYEDRQKEPNRNTLQSKYANKQIQRTQRELDQREEFATSNQQFLFNGYEPLIDQIIKITEREFNENDGEKIDTRNAQYIVRVEFISNGQVTGEKVTMVLDQSIPDTRTYKVIAPSRQNFGAANILTREDLFTPINPRDEFGAELLSLESDLKERNRTELLKKEGFEAELNKLTASRTGELEDKRKRKEDTIASLNRSLETATDPEKIARLETYKASLENQVNSLNADIGTLTDGELTDEDRALLRRRDQGTFGAGLRNIEEVEEEASYYSDEAARVADENTKFLDENFTNGTTGLQVPEGADSPLLTESQRKLFEFAEQFDTPEFGIEGINGDSRSLAERQSDGDSVSITNRQTLNDKLDLLSGFDPSQGVSPVSDFRTPWVELYLTADANNHASNGNINRVKQYTDAAGNFTRFAADFAPSKQYDSEFQGSEVLNPFETGTIVGVGNSSVTIRTIFNGQDRSIVFEHLEIADGLRTSFEDSGGELVIERGVAFATVATAQHGTHLHIDTSDVDGITAEEFEEFIGNTLAVTYSTQVVDPGRIGRFDYDPTQLDIHRSASETEEFEVINEPVAFPDGRGAGASLEAWQQVVDAPPHSDPLIIQDVDNEPAPVVDAPPPIAPPAAVEFSPGASTWAEVVSEAAIVDTSTSPTSTISDSLVTQQDITNDVPPEDQSLVERIIDSPFNQLLEDGSIPNLIAGVDDLTQDFTKAFEAETGPIKEAVAILITDNLVSELGEDDNVTPEEFSTFIDSARTTVQRNIVENTLEDITSQLGISENFISQIPTVLDDLEIIGLSFLQENAELTVAPLSGSVYLDPDAAAAYQRIISNPETVDFIENQLPSLLPFLDTINIQSLSASDNLIN